MKYLLLAALLFAPCLAHADGDAPAVRPGSREGQRIVHRLAEKATTALLAQEDDREAGACDSAKEDLLQDLSRLETKGSENLREAKSSLENGDCSSKLFAITLDLRAADSLN